MPADTKSKARPSRSFFVAAMGHLVWRHRFEVMRVMLRTMDASAPPVAVDGVEIRALSRAEVLAGCADPRLDLAAENREEALARGDECVGAIADGKLVGYVWSAFEGAPHLHGIWVRVPPSAVYKYKSFVLPEMRGRRIAPALYRHADLLALRAGRTVSVGWIAIQNRPSIAASASIGGRTLGLAAYWKPSRHLWTFHSPAVRRFGVRFYLR